MCKFSKFLGIDVSKEYFDAVLIANNDVKNSLYCKFDNNKEGVNELVKWLKTNNANTQDTLICLEHTGMYGKVIIHYLLSKSFKIWVEMSLKIIRSIGLQRGKNDKIDAERIAYYAMKNQEQAQLYVAPRLIVEQIRKLISLREHLVATRTMLVRNGNELKDFEPELSKLHIKHSKSTIAGIDADLKNIEKELDKIIESDEHLSNIYEKATSVTGVGKVTALFLICFTNEFTMYSTPRQLACYCGVVPFEYTSGKSVRAKPRVHFMSNKTLKKLLTMCARSCISAKGELREYYIRKVAEGKKPRLVINNMRNKLVHRICACIKNDKLYEKVI